MSSAAEQLSAEQVGELMGELTAGDAWRIQNADTTTAKTAQTLEALYRAAKRSGLANGASIETFLDRVRLADLGGIVEGRISGPFVNVGSTDGAGLQVSADSGA